MLMAPRHNRTAIDDTGYSSEGEIVAAGAFPGSSGPDTVVIELDRLDQIKLRPGRRVVVLTEDEFRQLNLFRQLTLKAGWAHCNGCDCD
jgi:hypothetical protein